jgi:hypothetical protein
MQMRRSHPYLLLSALVFSSSASHLVGQESDKPQTRQGNVWGVNLGWDPGWDATGTVRLLGLARHLVGDWGYIRHGISPNADIEATRRSVAMIRAYHLIPIAGGAAPDKQFAQPGKSYPRLDADGSMRTAARAKAAIWRKTYEAEIPFYAVEVMNEVNVDDKWPPDKYAQWLYDFATEVKIAYPGLKVCSCGMAGSGAEYYDKMLAFRPQLAQVVDFWGLHPYGANHPPEYKPQGVSLRSYEETEAVLKKHGVSPIRLMCTETGYELELGSVGKDNKYPPIKEDNRAEYMARAFRDYYVPRQTIECVAVFELWDFPFHNWNGWDLMYPDGRPRPIYEAMAAEPKSGGKDWLPAGPGIINGRITWRNSGIGIPRVVVYTEPGLYGAVSDDEGRFEITALPEGRYTVGAFRDGYTNAPARLVLAKKGTVGRFNGTMDRISLVEGGFGKAADQKGVLVPPGWSPVGDARGSAVFAIDGKVLFGNRDTQRITLAAGQSAGLIKYAGYSSAYPSEVFVAEVFVRGQRAKIERDGGPWLELALTNGRGEIISTAKAVPPEFQSDGKWHRITAAIFGPARSTRVRVAFGVDKAEGFFWFSEPFVGEADFPLPTDSEYKTTGYVPPLYDLNKQFFAQAVVDIKSRNPLLKTASISGQIRDFRGRPLAMATVATDAPLFVTVADGQGRYTLTAPAGKRVRVRAFALGETPAVSELIDLTAGQTLTLNLQTAAPPAAPELVNGDFNICNDKEAGLMTGWTGFGTTDGILEAGKRIIFNPSSYEGKGVFFAQAGSNTKNGGAYQVVQARPGQKYRLTGYVQTRTEGEGSKPLDNNARLGIDPTGGRDPDSKDVIWTAPTESESKWAPISVEATAKTTRITIFLRHEMRRANTWNLILFDGVKLEKVN